jgi:hypothetical protein
LFILLYFALQVVRMCLEKCYVALYSSMMRQDHVTKRAKYLLAKRERVEALYTSVQGIEEKSPEYKEIVSRFSYTLYKLKVLF